MTIRQIHIDIKNRPPVDFRMDLTNSIQSNTLAYYFDENRLPEPELIHLLVKAVRPGDYVVDAGACTGFFSLLMGALGATVLAIEPGENNLPELYENVRLNPFHVDVRSVALGNETAERDFLLIEDGGANSFTQPGDRPAGKVVRVPVRKLRDLYPVTARWPKLVKMDVEGAEVEALAGWLSSRALHCPYIALEYNLEALERSGHTGEDLRDLMRAHGYDLFILCADGMLPMLVPFNTRINCTRQNTNVLFSTPEDVGRLWQEVTV